ncbi:hypothetical protein L6452_26318 [Arctium lappa]|uniref:Uncharacterized protein n=1 Tax=Arctium lappa TaxID=4217 RepID=A0ACB9ACF1_ARCLA|nr:hypothetical protein L6452_26318 [Arctium lappa]
MRENANERGLGDGGAAGLAVTDEENFQFDIETMAYTDDELHSSSDSDVDKEVDLHTLDEDNNDDDPHDLESFRIPRHIGTHLVLTEDAETTKTDTQQSGDRLHISVYQTDQPQRFCDLSQRLCELPQRLCTSLQNRLQQLL